MCSHTENNSYSRLLEEGVAEDRVVGCDEQEHQVGEEGARAG